MCSDDPTSHSKSAPGFADASLCGCFAHARRYYFNALVTDPVRARVGIEFINKLFVIERGLKGKPPDLVKRVRGRESKPIVDALFGWADAEYDKSLDGSPIKKALGYSLNQEVRLRRFLENGAIPMHNNISEMHLRRMALGRKKLRQFRQFVGHHITPCCSHGHVALTAMTERSHVFGWRCVGAQRNNEKASTPICPTNCVEVKTRCGRSVEGVIMSENGIVAIATDSFVETVVAELRELQATANVELAFRIGELVVTRFYGGDPSVLHDHSPKKDASIAKLANHPELPFARQTLYRSVGIYMLLERLGGLSARKEFSLTHLRAVLGLTYDEQDALLKMAAAESWTTRQLEDEVKKKRRRGGRRPLPPLQKGVNRIRRAALDSELIGTIKSAAQLEPKVADEILAALVEISETVELLKNAVRPQTSTNTD